MNEDTISGIKCMTNINTHAPHIGFPQINFFGGASFILPGLKQKYLFGCHVVIYKMHEKAVLVYESVIDLVSLTHSHTYSLLFIE